MKKKQIEQHSYEMFLDTINHHRHDWMNDLQVLYGYVKLKKYDKIELFVDKIKQKMTRESFISRLGIPSLVLFLLSFRTQCKTMTLEIELEEAISLSQLPIDAESVSTDIQQVVRCFQSESDAVYGEPSQLILRIEQQADALMCILLYTGVCDESRLSNALSSFRDADRHSAHLYHIEYRNDGAEIRLRYPFPHNEV